MAVILDFWSVYKNIEKSNSRDKRPECIGLTKGKGIQKNFTHLLKVEEIDQGWAGYKMMKVNG